MQIKSISSFGDQLHSFTCSLMESLDDYLARLGHGPVTNAQDSCSEGSSPWRLMLCGCLVEIPNFVLIFVF